MAGGAVFFVTTAWTTMTGTDRLLVVFASLQTFGGLVYAAARLLNRAGTLPEVERALLVVTGLLVPVAGVVAGEVLAQALAPGIVALALALASGWFAARAAARIEAPDCTRGSASRSPCSRWRARARHGSAVWPASPASWPA